MNYLGLVCSEVSIHTNFDKFSTFTRQFIVLALNIKKQYHKLAHIFSLLSLGIKLFLIGQAGVAWQNSKEIGFDTYISHGFHIYSHSLFEVIIMTVSIKQIFETPTLRPQEPNLNRNINSRRGAYESYHNPDRSLG